MKILITNDDGYQANGILILKDVLRKAGHDVWVCAPESQRSACSRAVTHRKDVLIQKIGEQEYTCSGFPADCVLFALNGCIPIGKPDVVVVGINNGFNIGYDVEYSGTCGSAAQAASMGYPAIAISCEQGESVPHPYLYAAEFVSKRLSQFVDICPKWSYINVNVPPEHNGKWQVANVGEYLYYKHIVDKSGEESYNMHSEEDKLSYYGSAEDNTDCMLTGILNKISVSVVKAVPSVDENAQKQLQQLLDDELSFC